MFYTEHNSYAFPLHLLIHFLVVWTLFSSSIVLPFESSSSSFDVLRQKHFLFETNKTSVRDCLLRLCIPCVKTTLSDTLTALHTNHFAGESDCNLLSNVCLGHKQEKWDSNSGQNRIKRLLLKITEGMSLLSWFVCVFVFVTWVSSLSLLAIFAVVVFITVFIVVETWWDRKTMMSKTKTILTKGNWRKL